MGDGIRPRTRRGGSIAEERADRLGQHATSPFFLAEVEAIFELTTIRTGSIFVDVGCGNAVLVGQAARAGATSLGIDISAMTLRDATRYAGGARLVRATANRLPLHDSSADCIVAQHVIEHLSDPVASLREWRRVLRPRGHVVIVTPNRRYPDPSVYDDPTHLRIYDPVTLASDVSASGLRVRTASTIFPYLAGHTVFGLRHRQAFRRVPPWSWMGRSIVMSAEKPGAMTEVS